MNLKLQVVPLARIHQTWPLVQDFLAEAMKWSGDDYTVDQAKALLAQGSWLLLVAVDEENVIHGAASVNFINMPISRIAFITYLGGKLISSRDTYAQMVQIFKQFGATKIQGAARESIARLWSRYGFEERYRIVEAKI